MATSTLLEICQKIGDELAIREHGTATGGSTSTLVCASYPFKTSYTNANTNAYVRCSMYPTSGTEASNERDVVTYAPSTGTFTAGVNWSTGPASTNTFDIYKKGVSYHDIKDAVNSALEKLRYRSRNILTLITDGDMETSGVTNWTATNSTMTKVTSSGNLFFGTQSGRVVNSVANGNVQSATIYTSPDYAYYLQARVRASTGTAQLVAYDVTNSEDIDYEEWEYQGQGIIAFSFHVPSDCEAIAVQLRGEEATADVYWDDVMLLRIGAYEMVLPSWITQPGQILEVHMANSTEYADVNYDYPPVNYNIIADELSPLNQWRLVVDPYITGPLFIDARRPYTTLSTDSSTTYCPKSLAVLAGKVELLETLIGRSPGMDTQEWKEQYRKESRKLKFRNAPRPVLRYKL